MKLIAVTRVLNEDDIIEAFLRHHSAIIDHHILLDNGSCDRTLEIIRNLKEEGLKISVVQNTSVLFAETLQNTLLFKAAEAEGADWVIFLDSDEFLDQRYCHLSFREYLGDLPREVSCVELELRNYIDSEADDRNELVVPIRIRQCRTGQTGVFKICLRAELAATGVLVDAGNHFAMGRSGPIAKHPASDFSLAHFPRRSAWQEIAKSIIGRLKVLAAGQVELVQNRSAHYKPLFERLARDPASILSDENFMRSRNRGVGMLMEDPIAYLGGPLKYTERTDYASKALQTTLVYAEQLAQSYGAAVDKGLPLTDSEWVRIL